MLTWCQAEGEESARSFLATDGPDQRAVHLRIEHEVLHASVLRDHSFSTYTPSKFPTLALRTGQARGRSRTGAQARRHAGTPARRRVSTRPSLRQGEALFLSGGHRPGDDSCVVSASRVAGRSNLRTQERRAHAFERRASK